jgi:hypothetical protein
MPDSARSQLPKDLAEPRATPDPYPPHADLLDRPIPESNPSTPFRNTETDH